MTVLFFCSGCDEIIHRFKHTVEYSVPEHNRKSYHLLEDLIERLLNSTGDEQILVYLAHSIKELNSLSVIDHLFRNIRLILIVPDRNKSTITRAHSLYPRFVSVIDDDFSEVAHVLAMMIEKLSLADHKEFRTGNHRGIQTSPRRGDELIEQ